VAVEDTVEDADEDWEVVLEEEAVLDPEELNVMLCDVD
jgi:hypothetical protein